MIDIARTFALKAHGIQRYGLHPYIWHLDQVAGLLEPYGEEAQILGYLHAVLEQTRVSPELLAEQFGDFVAECIEATSSQSAEVAQVGELMTHARLALIEGEGPLAIGLVVRTAVFLARVRMSLAEGDQRQWQRCRQQYPLFREAAWREGLCEHFWCELERLLADGAFAGAGSPDMGG